MPKDTSKSFNKILFGLSLLFPLHTIVLALVNDQVPSSYMDEYFHYDQLAYYVNEGDFFYWNDKITTFPGLYIIDYILIKIFHTHIYSLLSLILLYKIFSFLYPGYSSINLQRSILIHFLPTIFFFNFLLYTDAGSMFFILLTMYFIIQKKFNWSGVAAIISVLFRQTNIVWVGYICLWKIIREKRDHFNNQEARITLWVQFLELIKILWKDMFIIIRVFKVHILLLAGFVYFVYTNQGIAVGDKSNHELSFHPTQMLYLLLFLIPNLAITPNQFIHNFKQTLTPSRLIKNKTLLLMFISLTVNFLIIVHFFTLEHPFILSDNRHYIFYIWKNFFRRFSFFKYLMCPLYSASLLFLIPLIISRRDKMQVVAIWFICSCLVLVPAKLIEPRYFTIPMVLIQFEIKPLDSENDTEKKVNTSDSNWLFSNLYLNILVYLAIDAALLYIFLYRPYPIEDRKELGRFMW